MLYQVSHAAKSFGANDIFEDVQFEIKGCEKITIVGRNGCGKSTFLRCMTGEMDFDRGTISMMNGIKIGYLAQKVLSNDELTVEEELKHIFIPVFELQEKMTTMEHQMTLKSDDKILSQYAELQEKFQQMNGYQWEIEMMTVFTRFGFSPEDMKRKISSFSGGQKTRIAFVKVLLSKPDILLLDEPTNHLDLETIEWLEGYVKHYPKAVVTVSHDRMFLDHTTDIVYEIEYGKMTRYVGNYSQFVIQKKNNIERQQTAYQRQQKDIKRLEELIEKFRYKANKASFAQSKIKYLQRMEKVDLVQQPDIKTFYANFTARIKGGEKVLEVEKLKIGYNIPLCTIDSLEIRRGDRIAIIGPNGSGKSTFLKTIMNLIPALSGNYLLGHQIEIGYFDQQLAQFSSDKTVLETLWDEYPDLDRTTIRTVLGHFLFSSDDVFKSVMVLSGGEKVRLSFAKLLLKHANLLILDEPTNHLDIPGKEALEESLQNYNGTIIFVSHDRYFIRRLANKLLILQDGRAIFSPLSYMEYEEKNKNLTEEKKEMTVAVKAIENEMTLEQKKKESNRLERKITDKENELEEKRALRFEPEYYQNYQKMAQLDEEIDDIHNELAHMYERWEALNS